MTTAYEIKAKAHLPEAKNLCRQYFKECGLTYDHINGDKLLALRRAINKVCFELCDDSEYSLIKDLEVNSLIKWNKKKKEGFLTVRGSYFEKREAVSFHSDGRIGFCGELVGCNQIPFIEGFVNWCDWLKEPRNHNPYLGVQQGGSHQMAQATEMETGLSHLDGSIEPKGVACARTSPSEGRRETKGSGNE